MDRRTDRPDGSGGGSPTVVTSRAADDNLIGDQDARTSDIMAPPRQPSRKSAPTKSDPARSDTAKSAPATNEDAASDVTAGGGVSPNGTPAGGKEETPASGAAANGAPASAKDAAGKDRARAAEDDTVVDGVPALPADTIAAPRVARPKASDADQATAAGRARPAADDSPVLSFGPPSAGVQPPVEDHTIAYPTESAVKSASDDTAASGTRSPFASPTSAGSWRRLTPTAPGRGSGSTSWAAGTRGSST